MIDRVTIPLGFRSLQAANLIGWDGVTEHREFEKMHQQKNQQWPVVGVSWFEYPWGDQPRLGHSRANYGSGVGHPTPKGQYPNGRSVEGIDDLLGNVLEWCGDWYGEYPEAAQVNPVGPQKGEAKVVRGGSWTNNPRNARVSSRLRYGPTKRYYLIGFRCAADSGAGIPAS